ncbi:hypothetical protein DYI25_10925 [Mesobacillus boroniphilus]|uniref:Uncharacterized protein n=1 Tax=Mesobacillus boroniphilus TaxID=308892 RepID=A0A944GWS7_9BACI|nr:hypothetical protein [Mesobacillus boroniphilus]
MASSLSADRPGHLVRCNNQDRRGSLVLRLPGGSRQRPGLSLDLILKKITSLDMTLAGKQNEAGIQASVTRGILVLKSLMISRRFI